MPLTIAPQFTQKNYAWTNWKAVYAIKGGPYQYYDDGTNTTVYFYDTPEVYIANMWDGIVPDPVIAGGYSQAQNNADLLDFQTNWLAGANQRITPSANSQVVLSNATVTVGGSQTFSGFGNRQISLFINVTAAPTGTSPGLQFTIQEVDPGNLTTAVGTTVTGASIITGPTTQEIILNLTTSSVIKISWIVVGTGSPTFTGVYATIATKPTTVISGVDSTGTERILQPDSAGNLRVIGTTSVGSAVSANPVIIGGANPAGFAGYLQLASDDSLLVSDGPNTQPIMVNATVTSSSISNLVDVGDLAVYLFINVKNAPTGTSPTLTFTMQEVDPGDKATAVRTSITGVAIKAIGTQILMLPTTTSGVIQVSWTIGGTGTPTFTGVYVTAIAKSGVTLDDAYGDYYTPALNSMVFDASTSTAGVAPGTVIGTTGAFTLYNPKTSTKNLVVQEIRMSYISGTLGSGSVFLCANTNAAATAVTGTAITPISTLVGGSGTSQANAFTTSTLPASPTMIRPLWTLTPMLATSVFQPFSLEEETNGKYIILPGCSLSLEAVAGAGTTPKVVFSMSWVEVPF
jgi:hypothetical protein